jgi:shikimate dehydrogenase
MKKQVGLIGWPVEHSLSPRMHNAALTALSIDAEYQFLPTTNDQLKARLDEIRSSEWLGANVTIPHKATVIAWLDEIDQTAQAVGAVNTIVKHNGRLIGYNTDVIGFQRTLIETGMEVKNRACAVLGAGGAAQAAVYVLKQLGAQVTVYARHAAKDQPLEAKPWSEIEHIDPTITLIVNATPIGMWPNTAASPWPNNVPFPKSTLAFDLIYNPIETRFMLQAKQSGARSINGLSMLLYQGAVAFEMWTGRAAPIDVMRAALLNSHEQ